MKRILLPVGIITASLLCLASFAAQATTGPGGPEPTANPPAVSPEPTLDPTSAPGPLEPAPTPEASPTGPPTAELPTTDTTPPPTNQSLRTTDVYISIVATDIVEGAVLVSGYAPVVETGGICTLTLARRGDMSSVQQPATVDATTTICGGLTMDTRQLAAGEWTVTLTYISDESSGISAPRKVDVQ